MCAPSLVRGADRVKLFVEVEIDADKVTSVADAGEVDGSPRTYVSLANDVAVTLGPEDIVMVLGDYNVVGQELRDERDDALPELEISWP